MRVLISFDNDRGLFDGKIRWNRILRATPTPTNSARRLIPAPLDPSGPPRYPAPVDGSRGILCLNGSMVGAAAVDSIPALRQTLQRRTPHGYRRHLRSPEPDSPRQPAGRSISPRNPALVRRNRIRPRTMVEIQPVALDQPTDAHRSSNTTSTR